VLFFKQSGPIDVFKKPADVLQEPYKLPAGFEWTNVNFKNQDELDQVCTTEICFYNFEV